VLQVQPNRGGGGSSSRDCQHAKLEPAGAAAMARQATCSLQLAAQPMVPLMGLFPEADKLHLCQC